MLATRRFSSAGGRWSPLTVSVHVWAARDRRRRRALRVAPRGRADSPRRARRSFAEAESSRAGMRTRRYASASSRAAGECHLVRSMGVSARTRSRRRALPRRIRPGGEDEQERSAIGHIEEVLRGPRGAVGEMHVLQGERERPLRRAPPPRCGTRDEARRRAPRVSSRSATPARARASRPGADREREDVGGAAARARRPASRGPSYGPRSPPPRRARRASSRISANGQ